MLFTEPTRFKRPTGTHLCGNDNPALTAYRVSDCGFTRNRTVHVENGSSNAGLFSVIPLGFQTGGNAAASTKEQPKGGTAKGVGPISYNSSQQVFRQRGQAWYIDMMLLSSEVPGPFSA
jgi:hypothetical protein